MEKLSYILEIIPKEIISYITNNVEEIRIRCNKKIVILYNDSEIITDKIMTPKDIDYTMDLITKSSIYAYFDDIKNGFITIKGGHRIGICGTAVYDDNKLSHIKDISGINIRVAREIIGVATELYHKIKKDDYISNTLIISPPNCGKTTLLRDLTRLISTDMKGMKVSVIDERGELGAVYMGETQNDLGLRCDVLTGYTKEDGILRAVRSMAPKVIVVDEIGSENDAKSIMYAKKAGVSILATIHGNDIADVNDSFKSFFDYYVFLGKNDKFDRIEKICSS